MCKVILTEHDDFLVHHVLFDRRVASTSILKFTAIPITQVAIFFIFMVFWLQPIPLRPNRV